MIGKTNALIYNGGFASILITGLTETDVVTATKDGKTYTGRWTTITTGTENQTSVQCHCIDHLPELGTYVVTASNGSTSKTQEVAVDLFTVYEIEMILLQTLKVYWLGDECEDYTGGWSSDGYLYNNDICVSGVKNSDHIAMYGTSGKYTSIGTINPINMASFNTLKAEINVISTFSTYSALKIGIMQSKGNIEKGVKYAASDGTGSQTLTLDISDINDNMYIFLRCGGTAEYKTDISKIWLE